MRPKLRWRGVLTAQHLTPQQIHCIWHHYLTINSQIVEKSNELWWVIDLYKLWLTDLSLALGAWIWLLTCQHWDLETQHLEPGSHVPSHRMTFLECYSMPLSWVVFNISRLEHFSDFDLKLLPIDLLHHALTLRCFVHPVLTERLSL